MNNKEVAIVAKYCKKHEFFYASSVFITEIKTNESQIMAICLIYTDKTAQKKYYNPMGRCNYDFVVLSVQDIFAMLLQRDQRIVSIFSHAIPLIDEAKIAAQLYSSLTPIKLYNKFSVNEKIKNRTSKSKSNKSFSILFRDIEDRDNFLIKTFIPLCGVLKKHLASCRFHIIWKSRCNGSCKTVEISIFFDKKIAESNITLLQKFLYRNLSELQLARVDLPFSGHNALLDALPKITCNKTNNILCDLTEELLVRFTNTVLQDNEKVTNIIYYYIVAAKSFFSSKSEFIITNNIVLEALVDESISSFTRSILEHQVLFDVRDKLLREYKCQSDKNKAELWANYVELLDDWDYLPNSDQVVMSLQSMNEIRSQLNQQKEKDDDLATFYFLEFCRLMFQCWDIPCYYRAYVPFCIKYLATYEI